MNYFEYEGRRIAFRDQGAGPAVVFVHGTPSSSAEFNDVIQSLSSKYRCIAIDHLGFGSSDKPEDADYRLARHSKRLSALLDHLAVRDFHLVVHDFGGPIAFPIAQARWQDIRSLTLMNTWAWPLEETEPSLRRQKAILSSGFMRALYRHFNFSARVLVKAAWGKHRPLSRDQHQAYQRAFQTGAERSGTISFLRSLFDLADPAWQSHRWLSQAPQKPTLLLWGMADPAVTPKTLQRWKTVFPKARVVELDRVGHFVADEAPELVVPALSENLLAGERTGRAD